MELNRTDSSNEDFISLVKLLDADLAIRDGDDHDFYNQFNSIAALKHCIVAYDSDMAVACGAFKPFDESTVEIKRMFTLPEARGKGLAIKVLSSLEAWAKQEGYKFSILETGKAQPEAIALYHKCGYEVTPNYGQYEGVENSVCFRKSLKVKN